VKNERREGLSKAHAVFLRTNQRPMVATAYLNSEPRESEKERPYFSVAEIQEFFETCPPDLVPHPLLRTLQGMFLAVEHRLGKKLHGNNFEFFLSMKHYAKGARYRSPSSVRYNLRRCERAKLLEVVYRDEFGKPHHLWIRKRTETDRGEYRLVPTYRLSVSILLKWSELHRRGNHGEVTPIRRRPAAPATPPLPPAPSAPLPAREKPAASVPTQQDHRGTERTKQPRFATLTRREVPKFVTVFDNLMQPKKVSGVSVEESLPPPVRDNSWNRILGYLQSKVNAHSFETWLTPTRYSHVSEDVLFVHVPTVEFRHAELKYADLIREAIEQLGLAVKDVRFVVPEKPAAKFEKMSREQALRKACELFGISQEHGDEVLQLHHRGE